MPIATTQVPELSEKDKERFWSKLDKKGHDDCWLWLASKDRKGYGRFVIGRKRVRANRVAYFLEHGAIPDGLLVCHDCPNGDNPACCNPSHLWAGTNDENNADKEEKGRANHPTGDLHFSRARPHLLARGDSNGSRLHPERRPKGEMHRCAKLNEDKVRNMRSEYADGDAGIRALAVRYDVSNQTVTKIINRKNWKHVL